ncbi:homoserine kinase [Candidatus Poribacteria bacterium]|nr:homoserine kinase [Candidatus Poribacteria bacterium]MYK17358.1 homoserine kinase [Candidatus Poribacteria bacterium]
MPQTFNSALNEKVTARIPASTTNLGPGFDVLGLALQLYSTVTLEPSDTATEVVVSGVDADKIPNTPEHVAFQAVELVFKRSGTKRPNGFKLRIDNGIPAIRGLGGSGTAILGGLLTANILCGLPFSDAELLNFATEMEGHPDNVAASLYGGIVVSAQEDGHVHTIRLTFPPELSIVLAIPNFPLSTKQAREVLPKSVDFADAIYNTSRSTLLIASIATGQFEMLKVAMKDKLHQPYRTSLIPGFNDVAEAAIANGALSVALSGAGPTVAAYCLEHAEQVAKQMQTAFNKHQIVCDIKILKADAAGANVQTGALCRSG